MVQNVSSNGYIFESLFLAGKENTVFLDSYIGKKLVLILRKCLNKDPGARERRTTAIQI